MAAAHVGFLEAAFFGKANILDILGLGFVQIVFGCKTAIKSGLERIAAIKIVLAVKHDFRQARVGGIAFND